MYTYIVETMLSKRYLYILNHRPMKKLETMNIEEGNMAEMPEYESSNDNKG